MQHRDGRNSPAPLFLNASSANFVGTYYAAAATFGHGPRSQKQLWKLNFQRDTYNRLLDHMDHQK